MRPPWGSFQSRWGPGRKPAQRVLPWGTQVSERSSGCPPTSRLGGSDTGSIGHLSPKSGLSALKLFGAVTAVLLTVSVLAALGEGPPLWLCGDVCDAGPTWAPGTVAASLSSPLCQRWVLSLGGFAPQGLLGNVGQFWLLQLERGGY